MTEEQISIRSIQHWLYCRHRWGLLKIDCAWAENYYVTKANLLHRRVHEDNRYVSKAKVSHTGVTVYNDKKHEKNRKDYSINEITFLFVRLYSGVMLQKHKILQSRLA